ncbi:MAG TPA: TIGR02281 family clan AA aspartic protease [Pseudomonadales bacterium]|nr:TIGR02281 family clan AA aspartic protease [Pseudomonadales bacterium]
MQKIINAKHVLVTALLLASCNVFAVPDIRVNGLMSDQAVVTIDGKQHIMKVGKPSAEGVSLLSADKQKAVFEWQGEHFERTLDKQITSNFSAPTEKNEVRIERGRNDHFFIPGQINGRSVNFMVDTGAFAIAMNPAEADRIGLDWRKGERFTASTAGGGAPGYEVVLSTVSVGDITIHNVKAAVIVAEGSSDILLGMSFLSQTEMHEDHNALVLRKKY